MENFYDYLNENYFQWDRRNDTTIVVWISGYRTPTCYDVEEKARQSRAWCVSMDFDSMCGKTKVVIKHKK